MTDDDNPTIEVTEGGVEFPVVDVLTGRGVVFGKSGSGKSNTIGLVAEQLLAQGRPLAIIDTDGEHYGLKEEHEILHVGADDENCDAAVTPDHAEQLARLAIEEGYPIILDTSEFIESGDGDELVRRFALELFRLEKRRKVAFPIFLEEAHEFIPQVSEPDATAKVLIKVAKRGRKHGLGLTAISQRPANVNKDVTTQYDWGVWHQLKWKQDYKVVRDILGAEAANAVQDLDTGEAIIDVDWLDDSRLVTFKRKQTFDAGATPGLGDFEVPEMQGIDADVIEQLQTPPEEDDADADESSVADLEDENERLRARVDDLTAELDALRESEGGADPETVERLRAEKTHLEDEVDDLLQENSRLEGEVEGLRERVESLGDEVERLREVEAAVDDVKADLADALERLGEDVPEPEAVADADQGRVEDLHRQIERLEDENERLRNSEGIITIPTEYQEFYEHPVVDDAIETAIEKGQASANAVWATVLTIADLAGPATYDDIAERGGYGDNSQVSRAVTALEARGVIEEVEGGSRKQVDFAFDQMGEIERKNKMQEEMEERIEQRVS